MRRRPRLAGSAVLFLTAGLLAALPAAGGREGGEQARPPWAVVVQYGDSLWTIAREHGDPAKDVRDLVWRIRRANHLDVAGLQPGRTVAIPPECLPEPNAAAR